MLNLNNALTKCSENHQHQTADCIELTQLTSESLKNQIREKAKLLDETEKRLLATEKLLDEIAEIHRIEFGYEYLHDYRDEHKDAYKIYQ
ncbi:MAG: hypothetical protein K0U45_07925 [Alphaproteobacteria bacterium]|nr:hypothetical protein [Alphaproteobacteria bacterium]